MLSIYNYRTGVRRRTFSRIACTTFTAFAIAGWLLLILIVLSIIFGFFDDLLILSWEATE